MKKNLVILGAGESGTGAALLGKAKNYHVFVSDAGKIADKHKLELIKENILFEEGVHSKELILKADLIIKSPGIPYDAEIVTMAQQANIEIIDEVEFAFRNTRGKIIAITGTNGKTTTTLLIHHLLKTAGFNVALVGNVGFSFAREVAKQDYDWFVLEISSFQLDGTKLFAPVIGVLLNITPDHLNRYEYSMEKYTDSKFQLIQQMQPNDHWIYFYDDQIIKQEIEKRKIIPQQVRTSLKVGSDIEAYSDGGTMNFYLKEHFRISQDETTLKGLHNQINTMSAVCAAYLAGVDLSDIREGLKSFKNAPHRLESVAVINGVEFINDSKATNLDSVVYAFGSYDVPLIWIAGGIDKGNDYNLVNDQVKSKVKALICLGKDNEKLKKAFSGLIPVTETQNVNEVVKMALDRAVDGDIVLLSPACASFDLFNNYEDRGNQFKEAVHNLKKLVESSDE